VISSATRHRADGFGGVQYRGGLDGTDGQRSESR
jgi:hypothetical protein